MPKMPPLQAEVQVSYVVNDQAGETVDDYPNQRERLRRMLAISKELYALRKTPSWIVKDGMSIVEYRTELQKEYHTLQAQAELHDWIETEENTIHGVRDAIRAVGLPFAPLPDASDSRDAKLDYARSLCQQAILDTRATVHRFTASPHAPSLHLLLTGYLAKIEDALPFASVATETKTIHDVTWARNLANRAFETSELLAWHIVVVTERRDILKDLVVAWNRAGRAWESVRADWFISVATGERWL